MALVNMALEPLLGITLQGIAAWAFRPLALLMGVALTQYYSPSIDVPLVISQKKRYGMAGVSYLAAWEFAPEGVRGASLVPFGVSGDPRSPHYFDQAKLLAEQGGAS